MDLRKLSIDEIGLSGRARNRLHRLGIHTVGELLDCGQDVLRNEPNLGEKSIENIFQKRETYAAYVSSGVIPAHLACLEADTASTSGEGKNEDKFPGWLRQKNLSIDTLELLSTKAYNLLLINGYEYLHQIAWLSQEELLEIPRMDTQTAQEILRNSAACLRRLRESEFAEYVRSQSTREKKEEILDVLYLPQYREAIERYVHGNNISVINMGLSARPKNQLLKNGIHSMSDLIFMTDEKLLQLSAMGKGSVTEIRRKINAYLSEHGTRMLAISMGKEALIVPEPKQQSIFDVLYLPEYRESIAHYVQEKDVSIKSLGLSSRTQNQLLKAGYEKMSDLVFMTDPMLMRIRSMGAGSAAEVRQKVDAYLQQHGAQILAFHRGDLSAIWNDAAIIDRILALYVQKPFTGMHLEKIEEALALPGEITLQQLKKAIGRAIAEGKLEYVDYRCYRVYQSFSKYLSGCTYLEERSKAILEGRLQGKTLEVCGQEYGIGRERVRQLIKRDIRILRGRYKAEFGVECFDEDYYRYFYETYAVDPADAERWLGISPGVFAYLELMDVSQGKESLEQALEDRQLDAGLRLKIKNYLNLDKIFYEGRWINKRHDDMERIAVRKLCQEDMSFREFARVYNDFLRSIHIEYDERVYYTESILNYRKGRMQNFRCLLWKLNEQIRYYDIDSRDYTQLLDVLNLGSYENVELTTQKFMEDYPDIMRKYDIRDQYELHNLLRKIVPEGSYHDFHCGKMPNIRFGKPNREDMILELILNNAPISTNDLCELVHREYGFDVQLVHTAFLQPFSLYNHQGIYSVDHKVMPKERMEGLLAALTDDFYYTEEIKKIFARLYPTEDVSEVNPYNLKIMGFVVLCRYVVRNHPSMDAYLQDLLTREDIVDLKPLRRRLWPVHTFSIKLLELKRKLEVIEFEPNMLLNFRKLDQAGVTRQMLHQFCDQVYDTVSDGQYFSMKSLRAEGFDAELYELGFSDWFYANLLSVDSRFSFCYVFGNLILYKGQKDISIKSFVRNLIRAHGSVDAFDLLTELNEKYGCHAQVKSDYMQEIKDTEVYHDPMLDRLYANIELYYRELDAQEGI